MPARQAALVGILSERLFGTIGIVIATIFNVVIVFVFAEAAPKTWALQHPERSALLVAPASRRSSPSRRSGWWQRGLIGITNVILPGKGLKKGPFVSEEELLAFADVAVEEDVIEHEERELIESIIEFGDTVAREVMVPRPDMVTVPATGGHRRARRRDRARLQPAPGHRRQRRRRASASSTRRT